jgi:hypothetical protein
MSISPGKLGLIGVGAGFVVSAVAGGIGAAALDVRNPHPLNKALGATWAVPVAGMGGGVALARFASGPLGDIGAGVAAGSFFGAVAGGLLGHSIVTAEARMQRDRDYPMFPRRADAS